MEAQITITEKSFLDELATAYAIALTKGKDITKEELDQANAEGRVYAEGTLDLMKRMKLA